MPVPASRASATENLPFDGCVSPVTVPLGSFQRPTPSVDERSRPA